MNYETENAKRDQWLLSSDAYLNSLLSTSFVLVCDVSRPCEDLPDPLTSSSRMVHRPAVQVNRFSWFNNANTDKHLDEKRREFRNSRKYPNSSSLFPPQQASLVSQERLQAVVQKVAGSNRFKGKRQQVFVIKEQQTNEHKVVTSLAHSRQKVEGGNQQDFSYKYHKESGTDVFASIYQYKTSMHLVKPSGNQKEQEMKQSHVHQSDVMGDAIKVERGELIARKDHTAPKHSCSYVKEDDYSSVNMNKQFFVQLACMFMVIGNVIKSVTSLNVLNLKRVIGLATLECVGWEYCVIAGSLSTVLPYGFGGKRSYAYGSLNSIIYASWIRYFGRYIYNLDFEYATRGSFKLVYSYIRAFDSSRMIWNQATLSSEFATLYCNKLYTLVYLLSEWSFSGIIIYDKYHRQFLFGLTLVCKAILLNQCFLLHSCVNWEELRPLVTSRAYGIKEGFNPCVIQKQFMPWYALVSLSPLSLLSLTILLCYFYYCCFYYYCYYFIVTDLYKTITSLSFSLLLSLYISFLCSLLLLTVWCESNPAHTVTLAYFSLLLLAVWCRSNPVHTDTVVYSCLRLSFSLLLLTVWCESNPAHTVTLAYFSLLLLAVWCRSNPVHTDTVVYSCLGLSFSLLLLTVWCESNPAHTVTLAYFSLLLLAIWCRSNPVHIDTVVFSCLGLSFSLLLLTVWCESNPAHPVALAYFSLLLLAVWCWSNPVHTDTVVYSCLGLSFSLLLLTVWCESNPAHTITVVYLSLLLLAVWCRSNPVHTDTVVYSYCLLSFLELSLAGYDDELLLAVGALYLFNYRTEGLRIDGNSCLYLLSPPAPAPHSKCLGQSVARFKRPFESRPADPARRERFLHLVTQPGTSGVIPATAAISATPRPLDRAEGPSSAHRRGFQCRRRLKF